MRMEFLRSVPTNRPGWVVAFWVAGAIALGLLSPSLTRRAAEGGVSLLGQDDESHAAEAALRAAWPGQAYESLVVAALYRPGGINADDLAYAERLAKRFTADDRPPPVLRALGPGSPAEVAKRLRSPDGTVALVAVPLSTSFVAPATHAAAAWLQSQTQEGQLGRPAGLEVRWTGDALIGRDYMKNVQISLDRAALATVVLLIGVLCAVYRSVWLPLVSLATIGISLVIARSVLAWLSVAGWEVSPLVELFLVALMFGSGTDFCLFVSWRLGEHWDGAHPARAMRSVLKRSSATLLTSAGTVIVGLLLMGTTRFKLFSTTGPSVAIGLAITVLAVLSLTPALLIILARIRPREFEALSGPPSGWWADVARFAMKRPAMTWVATVLVMAPLAFIGLRSGFVQDVLIEMPRTTPSLQTIRWLGTKFDTGELAPLSVVLESDTDLRESAGLAFIDDLSQFLAHQRGVREVRSATQPLGSTALLDPARLAERLRQVNEGQSQIESGARQLQDGLNRGAAQIRAALWIEERTGISLTASPNTTRDAHASNLKHALGALIAESVGSARRETVVPPDDPRNKLLRELNRAAEGAGRIASGAARAGAEVSSMLANPVGRKALSQLMITQKTIADHPDLKRSFDTYIAPGGRRARINLIQSDRIYSAAAMDRVETLRRRTRDFLGDVQGLHVTAQFAGENAESADIRALIQSDQVQSWYIVPIGVFLVLFVALRDPLACINLVATMVLTYAFALGATHVLFVTILGAGGIDWKVPYFLFVLLVAIGVDYNVFLMARFREESRRGPLREALVRAVGLTGGLISSAAAITACSFASFLLSPLSSLRQLGFALVVGIAIDALVVRPVLVPCGHWLLKRFVERRQGSMGITAKPESASERGSSPVATAFQISGRPMVDPG